jgi:hypothetical protein
MELRLSAVVATMRGLALRRMLVRLLERDLAERSRESTEWEDWEEEEEARRWRIRRVGSTSGMLAMRAKRERTGRERGVSIGRAGRGERLTVDDGDDAAEVAASQGRVGRGG